MELDKILFPTDFSDCANAALKDAVAFARRVGAELHLLHVVVMFSDDPNRSDHVYSGIESIYQRLQLQASEEMERLVEERPGNLEVRKAQRRGLAAGPAIVEYAAEHDIDLILIGTHGRRGLRRWLLGSVAEEVVRTAECPVVTVRGEETDRSLAAIERIIVPFDFSSDSQRALETALELAALQGSRIDLVHAVTPPIAPTGAYGLPLPSTPPIDNSDEVMHALDRHIATLPGSEVKIDPKVLIGPIAYRITDYAEESNADLIVIGSHGSSGFYRFLLGSVSEKVVRSAHCPVMVVRRSGEPGESADGETVNEVPTARAS